MADQKPQNNSADVDGFLAVGNGQSANAPVVQTGDPHVDGFLAVGQQQQDSAAQQQPEQSTWGKLKQASADAAQNPLDNYVVNATVGAAKGLGDTVHGVGTLIQKGANMVSPGLGDKIIPQAGQDALANMSEGHGIAQGAGKALETITEFALGDAAIKGLSIGEKLLHVGKIAKVYETGGPMTRGAIDLAAKMLQQGAVAGGQEYVKSGGDVDKAAIAGATGAALEPVAAVGGKVVKGIKSLAGGKAAVEGIVDSAPSVAEAGTQAKQAAAGVKQAAGEALGEAKAVAVPEGFQFKLGGEGTNVADTLKTIESEIGSASGGLDSLKDPSMSVVHDVVDELKPGKVLSNSEYEAVKQQLNSQISKAEVAAKNGNATGDVARRLKQIKAAVDSDYLGQISDASGPAAAGDLQQANKGFAQVATNQAKGPAKNIFKAATPEATIAKLSNADATTVKSFTSGMSEADLQPIREGTFKRLIQRNITDGKQTSVRRLTCLKRTSIQTALCTAITSTSSTAH